MSLIYIHIFPFFCLSIYSYCDRVCVSDWRHQQNTAQNFRDLHHDLTSCVDFQHPAAGDESNLLCAPKSHYHSGNTFLLTTTSCYQSTGLLLDLSSNPTIKTLEHHTRRPEAASLLSLNLNPKCSNLCLETNPLKHFMSS